MKKCISLLFALCLLAGCGHRDEVFTIKGHFSDASDTTLYLEHITLGSGIQQIDSTRLDETGDFVLHGSRPANPEFYRLRIGNQGINLAVDSTETITVEAPMKNLSFAYSIEGSGACDTIRLLCLKMAELERNVHKTANNRDLTLEERDRKIMEMVQQYKADVKTQFIGNNLSSASSYFACFQMLGGQLLFDPLNDKDDLKWVRAVANAWYERFPESERTQNLANIVAKGRRNLAPPRTITLDLDDEKVSELGIIDMTFPDIEGREVSLSSLKGNVVLLDFTAYTLRGSSERMLEMRKLYNKFHDRGFEIYQVSIDPDRHIWTQCCESLPWVSVYCEEGANSDMLKLYQVTQLPYYFLIDRNCDLNARQENISDLEQAIEALL